MKTDSPRWIPVPEVAKLVRPILKDNFPGIKFSVRSDGNSLRVAWIDGPTEDDVDSLLAGFRGGGFDGMIDLEYGITSWLLPDGTAVIKSTTGTEGSTGTVPAYERPITPHDDAEPVRFASKYIFLDREYSPAFWWSTAKAVADYWGFDPTVAPPRIRKSFRFKKRLVTNGLDGTGPELEVPNAGGYPHNDFNTLVRRRLEGRDGK